MSLSGPSCRARYTGVAVAFAAVLVVGAAACAAPSPAGAVASPAPNIVPAPSSPVPLAKDVPVPADLAGFFGGDLSAAQHGAFGQDRARVLPINDPVLGPTLRVDYPAGSASNRSANSDGSAYGGAQQYLQLRGGPAEALHLRYYVRFPAGFDFVKGGKLPGLYGGSAVSGGRIPDGTDGFSTRYMWRRSGAGEVYAYLPSSTSFGTSLGRGSWSFTPGQWVCIEQAVALNTPGRADGSVTVWVDGQPVFAQAAMTYRSTDQLQIDGVFFSTFFGGGDSSWASPTDQYADFAAFATSAHYIGPLPPAPVSAVPTP